MAQTALRCRGSIFLTIREDSQTFTKGNKPSNMMVHESGLSGSHPDSPLQRGEHLPTPPGQCHGREVRTLLVPGPRMPRGVPGHRGHGLGTRKLSQPPSIFTWLRKFNEMIQIPAI